MKYIRSYNESNSEGLNELEIKDFCEINLAYLMDDGLKVLVSEEVFDLKVIDYKVTLSFRLLANKRWVQLKVQVQEEEVVEAVAAEEVVVEEAEVVKQLRIT